MLHQIDAAVRYGQGCQKEQRFDPRAGGKKRQSGKQTEGCGRVPRWETERVPQGMPFHQHDRVPYSGLGEHSEGTGSVEGMFEQCDQCHRTQDGYDTAYHITIGKKASGQQHTQAKHGAAHSGNTYPKGILKGGMEAVEKHLHVDLSPQGERQGSCDPKPGTGEQVREVFP